MPAPLIIDRMRRLIAIVAVAVHFCATAAAFTVEMSSAAKHQLYDMPVSNNGARCRLILYKKQIPADEVAIVAPSALDGGLKGAKYMALHPEGKMPLLQTPTLAIPESDTICRYLLSTYAHAGPSFLPDDPRSNRIARWHDMYLTTIQGCLYKAAPPFGPHGNRGAAIADFRRQLRVIDGWIGANRGGTYLLGSEVSLADATIFPTMTFAQHMLPKFAVLEEEALPSNIAQWYDNVVASDPDFKRVHLEITGALAAWDERGRWDTIPLAGIRDDEPATVFDKIIAREIPAEIVLETDDVLAFKDVNPAAPAHVLVIPKDRAGLSRLQRASPDHVEVLGKLMLAAGEVSRDTSLGFGDGARIVINDGPDAGQEIPHLHLHVLGGRPLAWPPG